MYFSNEEKRILIEEALITGTSLEDFKKIIYDFIPAFRELEIPHDQPAHKYDIITHTYHVVQGVSENKFVKLAALFHDIGKPAAKFLGKDGVYHYWRHPELSFFLTNRILTNLGYDEETIRVVSFLVKYHDTYINETDDLFRVAANDIKPENVKFLCELQLSDLNAHADYYAEKHRAQTLDAHADYMKRVDKLL